MAEKSRKIVKKEFFEVKAPLISTKVQLYGASIDDLNNRLVKIDLTRSLRGKNMVLNLRIKVKDGEALAEPQKLELVGSYIRRMIRKGTDYVEDSFKTDSKENLVLVKPFIITRNKVSRAVRKEIRNQTKKFIENHFKSRTNEEIFTDIMSNKLQKDLSFKLKKIYPLALCEIRWFEILGSKKE